MSRSIQKILIIYWLQPMNENETDSMGTILNNGLAPELGFTNLSTVASRSNEFQKVCQVAKWGASVLIFMSETLDTLWRLLNPKKLRKSLRTIPSREFVVKMLRSVQR